MAGEVDYYAELELTRSASPTDVNDAFRRLALKFHPEKNGAAGAEDKFYAVCEAYEVLSNAERKATYDRYGSEGLRAGAPDANSDGFTDGYAFHGDAMAVFRGFWGGDNPFSDLFPPQDEFGLAVHPEPRTRKRQDPAVFQPIYISLEEAYLGAVKKMKITRRVMNDDGHTSSVRDKILTINVRPGWKEGTKVTFPKEGDQEPNRIPADIVFVIKYKDHPRFQRVGNDLVHTADIQLADALTGCIVEIKTLDDRLLSIPINDVVTPDYATAVPGEGMPATKAGAKAGALQLRFNVIFPSALSDASKALVRQALRGAE